MRNKYFENLNETIKRYFNILSKEIPEFLYDYIDTEEMQKQKGISVSCGTFYSKLYNINLWYSSLDHSVATALIVWNFTKDKKQTLSALFHDIATPTFKHCIDFMNGDYENQESTEDLTTKIVSDSKQIMKLLNRDGIKLEEVSDYHIYPIADNDTPRLSADRLEYSLSNGLGVREELWTLEEVKEIYEDIEVERNEDGIEELGFKSKELAEKFVKNVSKLGKLYIVNETKFTMQFLADVMKEMNEKGLITKKDLYNMSEREVIELIEKCEYNDISKKFKIWKNAEKINESDTLVENRYCVNIEKVKKRYINPLVNFENKYVRIGDISDIAKKDIEEILNFKTRKYAYLDF